MKGKFPGCVLLVELPRDMVDVNVHPAKTIVKFVGEKRIFDLVYHAAMAALDKREKPEPPQAKPAAQVQNPRGDFFANMTSQQYREQQKAETPAAAPAIARPVSAPPSAPKAAPSIAPQWKTRVPAVDTRAGGSAPLSDFVRHEMPASAPAQAAQPVQRSAKAVENPACEAVPLPMEEEGNRFAGRRSGEGRGRTRDGAPCRICDEAGRSGSRAGKLRAPHRRAVAHRGRGA